MGRLTLGCGDGSRAKEQDTGHEAGAALSGFTMKRTHILRISIQPSLGTICKGDHGLERGRVVVLERVALDPTLEHGRLVASPGLAAEVEYFICAWMIRI